MAAMISQVANLRVSLPGAGLGGGRCCANQHSAPVALNDHRRHVGVAYLGGSRSTRTCGPDRWREIRGLPRAPAAAQSGRLGPASR